MKSICSLESKKLISLVLENLKTQRIREKGREREQILYKKRQGQWK